jgi:hypothetical protein
MVNDSMITRRCFLHRYGGDSAASGQGYQHPDDNFLLICYGLEIFRKGWTMMLF